METPERFLAVCKLFEFYNFPESARESQLKLLAHLCSHLTEPRALDSLRNESIMRIVKSFKMHHPSMRNVLLQFVERVIDLAFDSVEVPKLVNLAISEVTSFQEVGMKA